MSKSRTKKQQRKTYALLRQDHTGDIALSTNGFIHVACKACSEKIHRSGVYSPRSNLYRCFQSGCTFHKWGSVYKYIAYYRDMSLTSVSDLVYRQKEEYLDDSYFEDKIKTYAKAIDLPPRCIPIDSGDTFLFERMKKYIQTNRGFDLNWLYDKYKMYYIAESFNAQGERNRYFGRIIIPFYDIYGDLVYFQARDFLGTSELRWDNPPTSRYAHGKDQVLFNIRSLYTNSPRIGSIHEGVFDAVEMEKPLGLDIRACSLGGLSISPYQLYLLAYAPVQCFFIILDPGTWESGLDLALSLSYMTNKDIYLVSLEEGDANELGKARVQAYMKKADKFSSIFYTEQKLSLIREGSKTFKNTAKKKFKIFNF